MYTVVMINGNNNKNNNNKSNKNNNAGSGTPLFEMKHEGRGRVWVKRVQFFRGDPRISFHGQSEH